jgi:regulatory protein
MVKHEWSSDELKHKAEAYCATAERCNTEVKNKLLQWGANTDKIEEIITHLNTQRYIDEARYCRAFTHDKVLYQGWGRNKIKAALYAKHLPSQHIDQAIDSIDETEYFSTLERVIATKRRAIKSSDPMAREKLIRFCLQRGFAYDEIDQLV